MKQQICNVTLKNRCYESHPSSLKTCNTIMFLSITALNTGKTDSFSLYNSPENNATVNVVINRHFVLLFTK